MLGYQIFRDQGCGQDNYMISQLLFIYSNVVGFLVIIGLERKGNVMTSIDVIYGVMSFFDCVDKIVIRYYSNCVFILIKNIFIKGIQRLGGDIIYLQNRYDKYLYIQYQYMVLVTMYIDVIIGLTPLIVIVVIMYKYNKKQTLQELNPRAQVLYTNALTIKVQSHRKAYIINLQQLILHCQCYVK
ncbi:Hypothetical_protein [Hexamita inflata]|uniref:Hypothetical_protein n=1 Tax=Hexamita inflata TaxID=28002 RepID=A0AA86R995_9EUKA|nr:Hypothetical protein HINF_LOCUS61819 [Hexamita inflata]